MKYQNMMNEKEVVEKELSLLMASTLEWEHELNYLTTNNEE